MRVKGTPIQEDLPNAAQVNRETAPPRLLDDDFVWTLDPTLRLERVDLLTLTEGETLAYAYQLQDECERRCGASCVKR